MRDSVEGDSVAATLRALRLAAGLTQAALAERAGLAERTVQDIERGISRPRRDTARRLLDTLRPTPEARALLESATSKPRRRRQQATDGRRAELTPTSPSPDRGRLPASLTTFIGRERELTDLRRLLESRRLLTLTGPGGCGKTRLATELASQSAGQFPDGVVFAAFAAIADPSLTISAIAAALGVRETPHRPLSESVSAEIGGRTLLLVLDNLEHLLPAAPAIGDLLAACPHLTVLATSRELLRLAGEQVYPVPPLAVPAGGGLSDDTADDVLAALSESESVQLFTDRARHADPSFRLDRRSAGPVTEICRRLDGLPLAIELAAARIRHLPVEAVRDRLEERLALLTDGPRDAPERHRALRDTIAWSYGLLYEGEQALFRRLAVFAGGFTIEAAEAVCTSPEAPGGTVVDGIASLVDKSLLRPQVGTAASTRYDMLETIHAYARERLEQCGELAQVQACHAEHVLQLAETAEPHLRTSQELTWLDRLTAERPNIRAALAWCAQHDPETGVRMAASLWRFWQVRSSYHEDRHWLERLLAVAPTPSRWRARLLHGAGCLAREQGLLAEARAHLEASVELGRALHDHDLIGRSLADLGPVLARIGDTRAAQATLEEAITILRSLDDERPLGPALVSLGSRALEQGDYGRAQSLLDEGVAVLRRVGDRWRLAFGLSMLGHLAAEQARWSVASATLSEARDVVSALRSPGVLAVVRWRQGFLRWRQGHLEEASDHLEAALALERSLDDRYATSGLLVGLAQVALAHGDLDTAESHLRTSLSLQASSGSRHFWGRASCALGEVAWRRGDPEQAVRELRTGVEAHRDRDDRLGVAECLERLAMVAVGTGRSLPAAHLLGWTTWLRTSIGAPVPPVHRTPIDEALAAARAALDPGQFETAWVTGSRMSLEAAVDVALGETFSETGRALQVPRPEPATGPS